MKCIVTANGSVSESLTGPLAAYISAFSNWLRSQGYGSDWINHQIRLAAYFSEWLGRRAIPQGQVSIDHASRFLQHRARRRCSNPGDLPTLRRLIEFLQQQHVLPVDKPVPPPVRTSIDCCVEAYARYLRDDRALAAVTIDNYIPFVRDFLADRFGTEQVRLPRLGAADVIRFVQRQAQRLHVRRAKTLSTALRSFLRYARFCGEVTVDLAAAVPSVANWSMTSIPRGIAADQVHQMLAGIDRGTASGCRDYAILLLLARLGVRGSAVVRLNLDDIDWNAARVRVSGKRGQSTELPLPTEVGAAIAAYLQRWRPKSTSRRVFLSRRAPIRGLQETSTVGSIVKQAIKRAGVTSPSLGTHQFRHGLASEMLRGGASLGEIGDLLGHKSPETTRIYAKVDLTALRALALPWPASVR